MIKLLQRSETEKANHRILWQQAEIGKGSPSFNPGTGTIISYGSCNYCRYKSSVTNRDSFTACSEKHSCNLSQFPYIRMARPINTEVNGAYDNPDETVLTYSPTGVYKQVTFEAQPHHVQLFLCNNGQSRCNAACWWHAWRLANKRTVTQCGKSHLCQNDGSLWVQMSPSNDELYAEFLTQL